ncbi:MAG: PKD domain-containing protein [Haloarculaceae archaeon]
MTFKHQTLTALVALLAVASVVAGVLTVPAGAASATDDPLQPGAVGTCGTIDQSGTYTLNQSLDLGGADGTCFEITASDVVLDGVGETVRNVTTAVDVRGTADRPLANVTVTGVAIEDVDEGVVARERVDRVTVRDARIRTAREVGIAVDGATAATLTGNVVENGTGETAIDVGDATADVTIRDNVVRNNTGGGVAVAPVHARVAGNRISGNGEYGLAVSGDASVVANNTVRDNGVGVLLDAGSSSNRLTDDAVYGNDEWDLRTVGGSTANDVRNLTLSPDGDTTVSFSRSQDVALRGAPVDDRPATPPGFTSTGAWVEVARTGTDSYVLLNVSYANVSGVDEQSLKLGRYDGGQWSTPAGVNGAIAGRDAVSAALDEFGTFTPLSGDGDLTPPVPEAGPDRTVVANRDVEFSAAGTTDDSGAVASYAWDFDDNETATGETVDHQFTRAGTYAVTLTATDAAGNADADTAEVRVLATDSEDPVARAGPNLTTVVGRNTTFDGSASTDNVAVANYTWFFNDGGVGYGETATHSYRRTGTYQVTLDVRDTVGHSDHDTTNVTVLDADTEAPVADAGPARSAVATRAVTLSAAGSTDDVGIASYEWDFGDGETATGETVAHAFASPGDHRVTLTVTDAGGNTDTDAVNVTVTSEDADPPVADAGPDRRVQVGRPVAFDGRGSSDDSGTVASYAWNFGDGSDPGRGAVATHTYDHTGTYTVTLTVADPSGKSASQTATVVVAESAPGAGPVPNWTAPSLPPAHDVHVNTTYPDAGEARIAVRNAQAGSPVRLGVRLDRQTDACHVLESQTVTPAGYGDLQVDVRQAVDAPAGVPALDVQGAGDSMGYFSVDAEPAGRVAGTTLQFHLDSACLDERGLAARDVALYRYADGEWTELDTSAVAPDRTGWQIRASADGTSAFAIGASTAPPTETTGTPGGTTGAPTETTGAGTETGTPAGTTASPAGPGRTSTTQPGFGVVVAVVAAVLALLAGALLAARRR